MDFDRDGYLDIVAGSYQGEVTFFKGSKEGFLPGEYLISQKKRWGEDDIFTNAVPTDFNEDGLCDLLCSGMKGIRMMLNTGKIDKPDFTRKLPVMQTNGLQVSSTLYTEKRIERYNKTLIKYGEGYSEDFHGMISYFDYDEDGIKDMLISPSFFPSEFKLRGVNEIVLFYKGVKTATLPQFEEPVTLFTCKEEGRSFPGTDPVPYFCDYNNDGKLDMLMGISLNYDKANNCFNYLKEYSEFEKAGFDEAEHVKAYFAELDALGESEKFREIGAEDKELMNEYNAAREEISLRYSAMEPRIKHQTKVPDYETRGYVLIFYGK